MTKDELATGVRGLGFIPAGSDLPGGDSFSKDQFIGVCAKLTLPGDTENGELTEAFRTFDRTNQGFLIEKEFMHMSTIIGEPFSATEVAAFKKTGGAAGGKIEWGPLQKLMADA
jgi:Ca2+-binding EF-hand superfamily protein